MKQIRIMRIIKGILVIGMLCLYYAPSNSFAQGTGESVDLDDGDFNPLTDDITKKIPTLEMLIDSAIINSHRLKYWDKEISKKEYALKSTKRDWSKNFMLGGEVKEGSWTSLVFVDNQDGTRVGTLGNTSQSRYSIGLTMRVPILSVWDRGNQIKLGKMDIESVIEKKLEDEKAIRAEVINLYNELVIQQNMMMLDIDNIEFATLTAEMADKQFENGEISLPDLSRVRDNLARARYRYVRTKLGFVNAYVMLQETTGIKFKNLNNWE